MRSRFATVLALALLAYAADDMVHEVMGHGLACLVLGIKMLGLSTIGLQTETSSRVVAAAGSIANVAAGVLALAALRRGWRFGIAAYFLWLFGFVNLMNGTGYLMASAATGSGDWAVVISGREPVIAWRMAMGIAGIASFAASVRWARALFGAWVAAGEIAPADIPRLTIVPYLAGGALFTLASAFNPVGPELILTSGVAASFGLTFGLLFMGGVRGPSRTSPLADARGLTVHWGWIALGLAAGAVFVAVLGPGVKF